MIQKFHSQAYIQRKTLIGKDAYPQCTQQHCYNSQDMEATQVLALTDDWFKNM